MVDRGTVRSFVAEHGRGLEAAQASGHLARSKLDLKDQAHQHFQPSAEDHSAFDRVVEQEIEAFCADMRLASVTVQTQVERNLPKPKKKMSSSARAFIITIALVIFAILIVAYSLG